MNVTLSTYVTCYHLAVESCSYNYGGSCYIYTNKVLYYLCEPS